MSGRGPCRTPADQLVAPEYRRWRREHGLQLPLHGQQLAAWLLLLLSAAVMGGVLVPALCPPLRLPAAVLAVVVLLVHGVTHIVATLLDPAHGDLRARRERVPVPEFDRNVHAHVIENGRCHLCNIGITSTRTKHCSVCNKCVDQFDHHCKWLNHCIGRRNYGWFLACVTSAAAVALLVLALSAGEIALLYLSPERLGDCVKCVNGTQALGPIEEGTMEMSPDGYEADSGAFCSPKMTMFGLPAPRSVFFSTAGVFALLSLLCGILLIHLLLFHVYIMARDMTTYEYIRGLAAPRTKSPSKQTSPRCRFLSEALHKNRVRPGPPVQPPSRASGSTSPAGRVSSRGSAPPSRASRLTGVSVETLAREAEGMERREREREREGEREGGHSPEGCSWPRRGGEKSGGEKTGGEKTRGENGPVGAVGESGAGGDASTSPRTETERRRDRDTQSASEHRSILAKLVKSVRALSAFPVFTAPTGIAETPQTCVTSNGHAVGISSSTTDHLASPQSPPPSETLRKEPLGSVEASHDLESPPPGVTQVMSRWRRPSLPWLLLDGSGDPIEPESASAGDEAPYHWTGKVHTTGQTHT